MPTKLDTLKNAVLATQQTNLFGGSKDGVINACVDYLISEGYRVVKPLKSSRPIKNTKDLVEYFYTLLNAQHPENYVTSYNEKRDMAIAKKFVQSRMNLSGINKAQALNECGQIVKIIFDNYEKYSFKYDISFAIFGQSSLKWVTDKAIQELNKKLRDQEDKEAEILRQKALDHYNGPQGWDDIEEVLKKMEED